MSISYKGMEFDSVILSILGILGINQDIVISLTVPCNIKNLGWNTRNLGSSLRTVSHWLK